MRKIRIADETPIVSPATAERSLSDPLQTTDVAVNHYALDPGSSFAYGFHAHESQEEVFYVESGTVTFETDDGEVTVGPGEVIRFGPGEHQQGINRGSEPVVALAIGAPRESGALDLQRECPDCGRRTPHRIESAANGTARATICEDCGRETGRFTRET